MRTASPSGSPVPASPNRAMRGLLYVGATGEEEGRNGKGGEVNPRAPQANTLDPPKMGRASPYKLNAASLCMPVVLLLFGKGPARKGLTIQQDFFDQI